MNTDYIKNYYFHSYVSQYSSQSYNRLVSEGREEKIERQELENTLWDMNKPVTLQETESSVYNNDYFKNTGKQVAEGENGVILDVSSLFFNQNCSLNGTLSNNSDVDYYTFDTAANLLKREEIYITMKVPEGTDYTMTVYDKDGNQVGKSETLEDGTKQLIIPKWCNSRTCTMKVEAADGSKVSTDKYSIQFRIDDEKSEKTNSNNIIGKDTYDQEARTKVLLKLKSELEEAHKQGLAELHQKQYADLPDSEKYTGTETVEELIDRMAAGDAMTLQEKKYIEIYGNMKDVQKAEAKVKLQQLGKDFEQSLKDAGIELSEEESLNISIASNGMISVSGAEEETNKKIEAIINDKYSDRLFASYTALSEGLNELNLGQYKMALDIQEIDRYLYKISDGKTGISDIKLATEKNGVTKKIQGLPEKVDKLINQADVRTKYSEYNEALLSILSYRDKYGEDKLPYFNTEFTYQKGIFTLG